MKFKISENPKKKIRRPQTEDGNSTKSLLKCNTVVGRVVIKPPLSPVTSLLSRKPKGFHYF